MAATEEPKAVYVAFEAFPRPKGASTHVAFMVQTLAEALGSVWLLCLGYGEMPAFQQEGRVSIFRYKEYHPNLLRRAEGFASFVAELVAEAASSLELVAFRDPWGGVPALIEARGRPSLFEVNALPSWELAYTRPAVAGNAALLAKIQDMEDFCLMEADRIVTVSPVTARALGTRGVQAERIAVVPNAAAPVFFETGRVGGGPEIAGTGPEKAGIGPEMADGAPVSGMDRGRWVGYVGSLHPWQGLETLVDALALAAPDLSDVGLALVHPAKKRAARQLRKRARKLGIEDRVLFLEPMGHHGLAAFLARVDVAAAPLAETARNTFQGCCPIKIIESMAAGTPVLASNLAVTRALIRHGHDGWLAEPDDPRGWAQALVCLFGDADLRARLGSSARQTAAERFSWPVVRRRLLAALPVR